MFQRIFVEEWQRTFSLLSFTIFFAIFLLASYRAIRMSRKRRDHLKNLPLAPDDHETAS
jgi:hypothetical protein